MTNNALRYTYQDAELSVEQQVGDLLGRMSLDDGAGLRFARTPSSEVQRFRLHEALRDERL